MNELLCISTAATENGIVGAMPYQQLGHHFGRLVCTDEYKRDIEKPGVVVYGINFGAITQDLVEHRLEVLAVIIAGNRKPSNGIFSVVL